MRAHSWPLVGFVAGGLVAAAIVAFGLWSKGPGVFCAGDILCTKNSYLTVNTPQQITLGVVSDDPLRLGVAWATNSRVMRPRLEYRLPDATDWLTVEASSRAAPRNGLLATDTILHQALLAPIQPGTAFEYRVVHDIHVWEDGQRTGIERFTTVDKTARVPPDNTQRPLSVAFISDTGLSGRVDGLASGAAAIRRHLGDDAPHLILGGGDYAYANRDGRFAFPSTAIDEWLREWSSLLERAVFVPQWGNHECCLEEKNTWWLPRFVLPEQQSPDGLSYAFDLGDIHFVSFYAPGYIDAPTPSRLAWLERTLEAARNRGQTWLIVYQHEPIFGHGESHPANPETRARMMPILERHRVDLHLSAHDQNYERTHPIRTDAAGALVIGSALAGSSTEWDGVIYAKVSPAGKRSEITQDFSYLPDTQPPTVAVASDTAYHYAMLNWTPDGTLDYIAYAVAEDGRRSVLDRFTLRR